MDYALRLPGSILMYASGTLFRVHLGKLKMTLSLDCGQDDGAVQSLTLKT